MKYLFLLVFVIVLSCSYKEQSYISIEQKKSDYPISLALDHDTIKYMDIPLTFLMNKTSSKKVVLSSCTYLCASDYTLAPHAWDFNAALFFNVNGKVVRTSDIEGLREMNKQQREVIVYIRYQCFTPDFQKIVKSRIKLSQKDGIVKIGSVQELKNNNKELIENLLQHDSICFSFDYKDDINEYRVGYVYMPVSVK